MFHKINHNTRKVILICKEIHLLLSLLNVNKKLSKYSIIIIKN